MDYQNFKRFRLVKNSKNPTSEWCKKTQNFRSGPIEGNTGIPTGKVNDITVIDFDFYNKDSSPYDRSKCKFSKKFHDFIDLFDTYSVETASGGYHLYFKYDADLKQTVCKELHIDIRNDGGYVVAPDSVINNREYIVINNSSIKPIPPEFKTWILEDLYTIKPKPTKQVKDVIVKQDKRVHSYNINKGELKDIVNNLDSSYWTTNFLKFTSFMKFFNNQPLWDKVNQSKPNYDYDNNINKFWDTCTTGEALVDSVLSPLTIDYCKFKPTPLNIIKPHTTINVLKLGYEYFKEGKNYIVKSDTGTGKTTSFMHYVTDKPFISIVSRISLGEEQYNHFSQHGITCKFYKLEKDFKTGDNIIVTIDSIKMLYDLDLSKYVIYLDEFNSMLEYLVTSQTLSKFRSIIYLKFRSVLKSCKQIIATDADINDVSIGFFNTLDLKYNYIVNSYQHNKDVECTELSSFQNLLDVLKTKDKFMCCCDYKANAEMIFKHLNDSSIKLIVGGTDEYVKLDDYDKIIFSPKIMYGIDSTMNRPVFCYYKEHTINPTGYIQQIARCRNIDHLYYCFEKKAFVYSSKTIQDIKQELDLANTLGHRFFKDDVSQTIYGEYNNLLVSYLYRNDCYNTNKFAHFINLLDERGFKRNHVMTKRVKAPTILKKEMVQDKLDNFDIKDYSKINAILKVPLDQADEFKDYFIDTFKLQKHFNVCRMMDYEEKQLKDNIVDNSQDFNVNKVSTDKAKLLILKRIKANNDIKDLNVVDCSDADKERLLQEFKISFKTRSKLTDLTKCLMTGYKQLFGNEILTSTEKYCKDENRKTVYKLVHSLNPTVLDNHLKLQSFRNVEYPKMV